MKRNDLGFGQANLRRYVSQIRTIFTAIAHVDVDEPSFGN